MNTSKSYNMTSITTAECAVHTKHSMLHLTGFSKCFYDTSEDVSVHRCNSKQSITVPTMNSYINNNSNTSGKNHQHRVTSDSSYSLHLHPTQWEYSPTTTAAGATRTVTHATNNAGPMGSNPVSPDISPTDGNNGYMSPEILAYRVYLRDYYYNAYKQLNTHYQSLPSMLPYRRKRPVDRVPVSAVDDDSTNPHIHLSGHTHTNAFIIGSSDSCLHTINHSSTPDVMSLYDNNNNNNTVSQVSQVEVFNSENSNPNIQTVTSVSHIKPSFSPREVGDPSLGTATAGGRGVGESTADYSNSGTVFTNIHKSALGATKSSSNSNSVSSKTNNNKIKLTPSPPVTAGTTAITSATTDKDKTVVYPCVPDMSTSTLMGIEANEGTESESGIKTELPLLTKAVDIYSIGMIYAECVLGVLQPREDMIQSITQLANITLKEKEFIIRCLDSDASKRPSVDYSISVLDHIIYNKHTR